MVNQPSLNLYAVMLETIHSIKKSLEAFSAGASRTFTCFTLVLVLVRPVISGVGDIGT